MTRQTSRKAWCLLATLALFGCGASSTGPSATKKRSGGATSDGAPDAKGGSTADSSVARTRTALDAATTPIDASLSRNARDAGARSDAASESPDATSARSDGASAVPTPDATADATVAVALEVSSIAAGYAHACIISSAGELYCWGQNGFGQLGLDDLNDRAAPVRVGSETGWSAIATGRFHSCGIRAGSLYCWGSNAFGQAAGSSAEPLLVPTQVVAPPTSWIAVTAGDWHTCALDDQGQLYCFGYDLLGRLGNGKGLGDTNDPGESVSTPTAIDAGATYIAIDAGATHTCGVRSDASLWCWGLGDRGQLGVTPSGMCMLNTVPSPCSLVPTQVPGALRFARVSAGDQHTCALTDDKGLYCFGANDLGQLGAGDTQSRTSPYMVSGEYLAVSAGATHSCAVRSDRHLFCFGNGESDQLGLMAASMPMPTEIAGETGFLDVSAGALCTCAVSQPAKALCWGRCAYSDHGTPFPVVSM